MEGTTPQSVVLEVVGWAQVEIAPDQWPAQRRRPGSAPADFPPTALKQADEQAVAGLAAVYQALHDHGKPPDHQRWGVIGCPRFQGRSALRESLQRYAAEGAWGMSPHFIPHRSLHSLAGLVSQMLGLHGPNFGVDASRHGGAGLLAAAALLQDGSVPGLWLIETGFVPELPPPADSSCQAVALALQCHRQRGATLCVTKSTTRSLPHSSVVRRSASENSQRGASCYIHDAERATFSDAERRATLAIGAPVQLEKATPALESLATLVVALTEDQWEQTWSLAPGLQLHLGCEPRARS